MKVKKKFKKKNKFILVFWANFFWNFQEKNPSLGRWRKKKIPPLPKLPTLPKKSNAAPQSYNTKIFYSKNNSHVVHKPCDAEMTVDRDFSTESSLRCRLVHSCCNALILSSRFSSWVFWCLLSSWSLPEWCNGWVGGSMSWKGVWIGGRLQGVKFDRMRNYKWICM